MLELWAACLGILKFILSATFYNPRNWVVTEDERNEARRRFVNVR